MDDYLKTYRQFKKCNNLVQHHKKKRIRKKNIGRVARMLAESWRVVTNNGMSTEEFLRCMDEKYSYIWDGTYE